jgi:hypothetical protein
MSLAGRIALAQYQHFNNGHSLLGAKLSQDGKHEIAKIGNNAVIADVSNKKVVGMSAGNLPARKARLPPSRRGLFPYEAYGYCLMPDLTSIAIGIRPATSTGGNITRPARTGRGVRQLSGREIVET